VAPRKSPLPWILAGGGVAVIAIVVVLILVLSAGSDTSSPQGMSEEIARVVNERDINGAKALYCDQALASKPGELDIDEIPADVEVNARAGRSRDSGDTGTAQVIMEITQEQRTVTVNIDFELKKQGGNWCITDSKPSPDNGPGSP
jgi:hypothetical protein